MKKKILTLTLLLFLPLLFIGTDAMICQKTCDDTGYHIGIGPCDECIDGDWYIDCDGIKAYCPGHSPNQGLQ